MITDLCSISVIVRILDINDDYVSINRASFSTLIKAVVSPMKIAPSILNRRC